MPVPVSPVMKHITVDRSDLEQIRLDLAQGQALTDRRSPPMRPGVARRMPCRSLARKATRKAAIDTREQLFEWEGLFEVVIEPHAERGDCQLFGALRRD